MQDQLGARIAQMLENTVDTLPLSGLYRANITGPDPTDATSCISVPIFQMLQYATLGVTGTFANTTATATLIVWRGHYTGATTPSTLAFGTTNIFSPFSREIYTITATDRSIASSFVSDEALFAALGSNAVKVTVVGSPNGGVNLQLRRSV